MNAGSIALALYQENTRIHIYRSVISYLNGYLTVSQRYAMDTAEVQSAMLWHGSTHRAHIDHLGPPKYTKTAKYAPRRLSEKAIPKTFETEW